MARTTIDIDTPILRDLKKLQKREGKSLGTLVSELLSEALARHGSPPTGVPAFEWHISEGPLLVDPLDKEALAAILDEKHRRRIP